MFSTANSRVRCCEIRAQSSTSTPPSLSMNTRTSLPLGDISQSTSSYPNGGTVRAMSSERFVAIVLRQKKMGCAQPISPAYAPRLYLETGPKDRGLGRGDPTSGPAGHPPPGLLHLGRHHDPLDPMADP